MAKFNTGQSFADGDTVTGAKLNNITSQLNIYTGVISEQASMSATVSTADQLLIADTDNGDSGAANRITVQKLLDDSLTNGTYTSANLSGTITSNRTVATSATITTGTIPNLTSSTATITLGTIPTLTTGTTTSTAANITNGTVQTLTASTANITTGTVATLNSTTGTVATLNSTTGTITNLISTTGTVATLNSTTGTITGLNTTTGTIATLNSTTGTITNLSTTLAGDFTISQGTGAVGSGKITFPMFSTSATQADNAASRVARAWVNFDGTNAFSPNPSTSAIRASLNVSSITDNGAGDYTINFTVAMSDTNYCAVGSTGPKGSNSESLTISSYVSTSAVRVVSSSGAATAGDAPNINCVIFR